MDEKKKEEALAKFLQFGVQAWMQVLGPLSESMKETENYIHLNDLQRGRILNCTLVLEHLVNRYLREKDIVSKKDVSPLNGLTFDQKLNQLKKHSEPSFSRGLIDGIKAINTIRNKYAHQLDYKVSAELLARIEHMNDEVFQPMDRKADDYAVRTIENYTRLASAYIITQIGQVKFGLDNLWSAYPKVKTFFDERSGGMDFFARN